MSICSGERQAQAEGHPSGKESNSRRTLTPYCGGTHTTYVYIPVFLCQTYFWLYFLFFRRCGQLTHHFIFRFLIFVTKQNGSHWNKIMAKTKNTSLTATCSELILHWYGRRTRQGYLLIALRKPRRLRHGDAFSTSYYFCSCAV